MKQPMSMQDLKDLKVTAYDCEEYINDERTWDLKDVPREVLSQMLTMVKDHIADLNHQREAYHDMCPTWYDSYVFPMDCTKSKIEWAMETWKWDDEEEEWVKAQEEDSEE